jgi:CheY-like chemotaxis protein
MKAGGTVLIVDDEKVMRETIAIMLQKQGYHLEFAGDGQAALDKAAQVIPDVILLDIMMPDLDGFEVCRRLRTHPLLAQVPIVMVTALDYRDAWIKGIEAGADDFIFKPFETAELRTRVQNIIQLNRYRRLLVERVKFEWVIKNADDGYVTLDNAGAIIYANPRARQYLGIPAEDGNVEGDAFLQVAADQFRQEPREAWSNWPARPANGAARYLVRPESASSQPFWLQVTNLTLPANVDAAQIVRLRDVTEQMILQRDMWRFHSTIFHKLRTPLAVVLNALELLVRHAKRLAPDEVSELARRAFSGAQRLQADLEDVLQYVGTPSIAAQGQGFALSQLPLLVARITGELDLQPITIAGIDKLKDVRLSLSNKTVESIVWEVMENAQKFHPQKSPTVQIFAFRSSPREVTMWIGDDGQTLSPEQLGKVWTPYYQGEKQFTGEVAGMGLGLAMVASTVWNAGGSCRMYNRSGKPGVVVELVLPIQN